MKRHPAPAWLIAPPLSRQPDPYAIKLRIWAARLIVCAARYREEIARG